FDHYAGPVNWDISAEDFAFWRRGDSAEQAAKDYLELIEQIGHGIVLMHDSSDEEIVRRQNRALELTMLLVPELKQRGYLFASLAELPQIKGLREKSLAYAAG